MVSINCRTTPDTSSTNELIDLVLRQHQLDFSTPPLRTVGWSGPHCSSAMICRKATWMSSPWVPLTPRGTVSIYAKTCMRVRFPGHVAGCIRSGLEGRKHLSWDASSGIPHGVFLRIAIGFLPPALFRLVGFSFTTSTPRSRRCSPFQCKSVGLCWHLDPWFNEMGVFRLFSVFLSLDGYQRKGVQKNCKYICWSWRAFRYCFFFFFYVLLL